MKLMREKENRNSFSGGLGGLEARIYFLSLENRYRILDLNKSGIEIG
jgi:hypothetical protein